MPWVWARGRCRIFFASTVVVLEVRLIADFLNNIICLIDGWHWMMIYHRRMVVQLWEHRSGADVIEKTVRPTWKVSREIPNLESDRSFE